MAQTVRVQWAIVGWAKPHFMGLLHAAPQAMCADGFQIAPWCMILAAQSPIFRVRPCLGYLDTFGRDDVPKGQWSGLFGRA